MFFALVEQPVLLQYLPEEELPAILTLGHHQAAPVQQQIILEPEIIQ